jgi:hypothetical protein
MPSPTGYDTLRVPLCGICLGLSQALGCRTSSAISQTTPIHARVWSEIMGSSQVCRSSCAGFPVAGWGLEKSVGIEVLLVKPDAPKSFEDFALGVEPGMTDRARAFQAAMIKGLDGVVASGRFADRASGMIAQVLELVITAPVDALIAEGLAVTRAVGNAQGAIAPEFAAVIEA